MLKLKEYLVFLRNIYKVKPLIAWSFTAFVAINLIGATMLIFRPLGNNSPVIVKNTIEISPDTSTIPTPFTTNIPTLSKSKLKPTQTTKPSLTNTLSPTNTSVPSNNSNNQSPTSTLVPTQTQEGHISPVPTNTTVPTTRPTTRPTSTPAPTATPTVVTVPSADFSYNLSPQGGFVPNGRGQINGKVIKNYNGYWDFQINTSFAGMIPGRKYQLWLCGATGCSSQNECKFNPDNSGNSSFNTTIFGHNQSNSPAIKFVVWEMPDPGLIPNDPTACFFGGNDSTPCLKADTAF